MRAYNFPAINLGKYGIELINLPNVHAHALRVYDFHRIYFLRICETSICEAGLKPLQDLVVPGRFRFIDWNGGQLARQVLALYNVSMCFPWRNFSLIPLKSSQLRPVQ